MSVYCGTPTKLRVTTPKGRILLRGEQDSSTVMTVLTSPTRTSPERNQLYYCENDWETLGDNYGLEVDTERREEKDEVDLNNGRCFRERIRVQDSEKILVGGEWGDQFHVAYIDGVRPVLIQIKCKDDSLVALHDEQEYCNEDEVFAEPGHDNEQEYRNHQYENFTGESNEREYYDHVDDNLTEQSNKLCNNNDENNFDNKDIYLMYYIEQETTK